MRTRKCRPLHFQVLLSFGVARSRPKNSAPYSALARSTTTRSKGDSSNESYAARRSPAFVTKNPRSSRAPWITLEGAPSLNNKIRCDRNIQDRAGGTNPASHQSFQLAQIAQVLKTINAGFVSVAPAKIQSITADDRDIGNFHFIRNHFRFQRSLSGPFVNALSARTGAPQRHSFVITHATI